MKTKTMNVDVTKANAELGVPDANAVEMVAALAASLGVTLKGKPGEYEPDAFLSAIRSMRDGILEAATMLKEQNERQELRQADLDAREERLAFREKRCEAMVALIGHEPKKSSFLSKLFT